MPETTIYGYLRPGQAKNLAQVIIEPEYLPGYSRFLERLRAAEEKTGSLKLLKIVVDYHFKRRTVDQNSLLWVLYTIWAYAQNAGMKGHTDQMVTPEQLYENDIQRYAPVVTIECKTGQAEYILQEYRRSRVIYEDPDKTKIEIVVTTSHFNTKQMAEWIDRMFNEMAYLGIPTNKEAEMRRHWKDWRQMLDAERVYLHEGEELTGKQYKAVTPICEATGDFLGEGGSLAHIVARGMGGNPEEWKDKPGNWLHLCDTAHALFDNGNGRTAFLNKYPHLKNKIEDALKKEVGGNDEQPEIW